MLEVGVDNPGEHAGQLAVKAVLDHGVQLIRGYDHELLKRAAQMRAPQAVGDAAHVGGDLLLDPALEASLRPAPWPCLR